MIFSITEADLIRHTEQMFVDTFEEEFVRDANMFCKESNVEIEIYSLLYLFRQKLIGELHFEELRSLTPEQLELLSSLYKRYEVKIREQQALIESYAPGKAGHWNNEVLVYETDKFHENLGNRELKDIDEIMLFCEYFNIGVEFRVAFAGVDMILPGYVQPWYSRLEKHEEGLLADRLRKRLQKLYEQRLRDAGYDLDSKVREIGNLKFYSASFGCEKYDFPEDFTQKGSKLVLSKEEAIRLLQEWSLEFGIPDDLYCKLDFNKDGSCFLTMSEGRKNTAMKSGYTFSLPGIKSVRLKPEFFKTESGEAIIIDGKKRIRYLIP